MHHALPVLLFAAALAAGQPLLSPQAPVPVPPAGVLNPRHRPRVLFDLNADGTLWAKGSTYKMAFAAGSATFVPVLGPKAPHNFPLGLRLATVMVDGIPLVTGATTSASRDGDRVWFDHGPIRELWRLGVDAVEQDFELAADIARGEVVVRLAIESPLAAPVRHEAGGLWFAAGTFGGVHYGDAVVYDGAGRRVGCPVTAHGDHIEIRVPASYMAQARGRVTIDPVVRTFAVDNSSLEQKAVDVAYAAISGVWLAVYEEVVTARDIDLVSRRFDRSGGFLGEVAVNISAADSTEPSVAYHRSRDQFLVAWRDTNLIGSAIAARTRVAASDQQGPVLTIRSALRGTSIGGPDVGGGITGDNYFVVWPESTAVVAQRVMGTTVSTTGSIAAARSVANGLVVENSPAITKSAGPGGRWMVVYTVGFVPSDVRCAVIDSTGTALISDFPLTNSATHESNPRVAGDGTDFLLLWVRDADVSQDRIMGRRLRFTTSMRSLTGVIDLTAAEPRQTPIARQIGPRVASHGCRFTYSYSEDTGAGGFQRFAAVVAGDNPLVFVEGNVRLTTSGASAGGMAAVEDSEPATTDSLAMVAFSSNGDVFATLFDPLHPGGGFTRVQTGCGAGREEPAITTSGEPALAGSFSVTLFVGNETPVLFVGSPAAPLPLCAAGCALGLHPVLTLPVASAVFRVPCDGNLLLGQIAFQGVQLVGSFGATTLCGPPLYPIRFRTTDTLIATLR